MNLARFKTLMAALGGAFSKEFATTTAAAYWTVFEHVDDEAAERAFQRALTTCKFMPAPAELLELGGLVQRRAARAMIAWGAVRDAIDKHDYTASVDFGALVNAVVRNLGGWDTLCRASLRDLDNPGWLRKRFLDVYEMFADIPIERLNGAPLIGLFGGRPVRVAIGGVMPPQQVAPAPEIRRLAEAKSR